MLPNIAALEGVSTETWTALRTLLEQVGIDETSVLEVKQIASGVSSLLRPPLHKWHLRRREGQQALLLRLLFFRDPITLLEARRCLGVLLEPLLKAGVLCQDPSGVTSAFGWTRTETLLLISDLVQADLDSVMGHSQTTERLCRAALPAQGLASAMDLGCGAGSVALTLASRAERVVATDLSERAVRMTRVNARLNGVSNVEARVGSLFQPVAQEQFELIVSQPPFIPQPPGAGEVTYLYGGARGDELTLELLRQLPAHLTAKGRAMLLSEWPEVSGEKLEDRVRAALGVSWNLLSIQSPALSIDEHCALMATLTSLDLASQAFERNAMARREHLQRLGVASLRSTLTVITPAAGKVRTAVLTCKLGSADAIDAEYVQQVLDAQSLSAADEPALLAACLRLPAGTQMRELAGDGPQAVKVVLPETSPVDGPVVNVPIANLISWLEVSATVAEALDRIAEQVANEGQEAAADVKQHALQVIRKLLETGVLSVAR